MESLIDSATAGLCLANDTSPGHMPLALARGMSRNEVIAKLGIERIRVGFHASSSMQADSAHPLRPCHFLVLYFYRNSTAGECELNRILIQSGTLAQLRNMGFLLVPSRGDNSVIAFGFIMRR